MAPVQTQPLSSAQKTLALLDIIAEWSNGVRVSELARRVGSYRSTIYQQLITLVASGWMERMEDGRYRLTLHAARIGHAALEQASLGERVLPIMERLASTLHCTISLGILDRDAVLIVQRVEPGAVFRSDFRVGTRLPIIHSASGWILAAFAQPEELEGLRRRNVMLPTDEELAETRRARFRSSQYFEGVAALASPTFDSQGRCVAALSAITSPRDMDMERGSSLLQAYANDINRVISGRRMSDPALTEGMVAK
jgi:DNA-binding IclR family transcriptional regulator